MKIGLDIRMYGVQNGGIGRYAEQVFSRILELDKTNEFFLFYNPKNILQDQLESLKQHSNATLVSAPFRHYSIGEQTGFLKKLNGFNLDLVHFPNFNVPLFYKKRFIVTIHDMVHHKISGHKKSRYLKFLAYKKIIESAARRAKKIVTVSESSKKDIVKYLQVPAEKIKVIYEGLSLKTEAADFAVKEIKQRYLITKPYFLFVGVLERKKNIINLTRGFDWFLQKYRLQMDLVIVGKSDSHYPEIKHKALDIKHSASVIFTGEVGDDELRALYKGAYAFATASLHEGFGLPGVEALSFGLPLLASNLEVFNEIYDNAAIYFNPLDPVDIGEKMNLLARDSAFHEQLQSKSYERSLFFHWEKTAQETLEVYNQFRLR